MKEERRRILKLVAEGKLSETEAEALLDAVPSAKGGEAPPPSNPKYLRVLVQAHEGTEGSNVNVRVPFDLLRAGVRLAALLPKIAYDPINRALAENGVDIDVSKVKAEHLEDIVQHLSELSLDVGGNNGERVRVFCE